jgi:3-oxoacyl-[acyl-carrier-protein] synthase-3
LFVLHQANKHLVDAIAERLHIPNDKVFDTVSRYGNTGVASPLITYHEAMQQERIRPGDYYVIAGFGRQADGNGMQTEVLVFREP